MNKKILYAILGIAVLVVCIIWFINDDFTHIEDTNGADNYSLQTITDEDIVKREMASMGAGTKTDSLTNTETHFSNKFSGVTAIYTDNIIFSSGEITFTVNHAEVTKGNFKIVLVVDDEIVHEFKLNELTQSFTLEDVKGEIALVIAGESAAYSFDYYIN